MRETTLPSVLQNGTHPTSGTPPSVPLDFGSKAEKTPVWEVRSEVLHFQFGPLNLGTVTFRALSLISNPFIVDPYLRVPLEEATTKCCQAVVRFAMPIGDDFPAIQVGRGVIRYVARYGLRYIVELGGSFEEYLKKFSNKSRNTLKRRVKKSVRHNETPELRQYRSAREMMAFREIAIAISHRSYKKDIGWGFEESERFARHLEAEARMNRVRGYVLMLDGDPAAYVFCRIEDHVVVYKHLAYDVRFAERSPGTVLLYLMLKQLFTEQEFRLLDFDAMEYYPYKEFFSTRAVRCARVVWFRPTVRSIALFGSHCVVMAAWHLGAALYDAVRKDRRRWVSARRLARVPGS